MEAQSRERWKVTSATHGLGEEMEPEVDVRGAF